MGYCSYFPLPFICFFATGVNNFGKLPVLSQDVVSVSNFKDLNGAPVTLDNKITILGFFGDTPTTNQSLIPTTLHTRFIKRTMNIKSFSFWFYYPKRQETAQRFLTNKISEIAPTTAWKYAFGTPQDIQEVFASLNSGYSLDSSLASSFVFIIDKDAHLRGRNDDQDMPDGLVYGYNSADIGDINNRMSDDVKVVFGRI